MKKDRQLERDFRSYNDPFSVDRRDFLKTLGGGIVIAVSTSGISEVFGQPRGQGENDFNAYLRIGEDGRVTCYTGKIEMGQGPITSLPMELADELDVLLENTDIVMGDTDLCPWDMGTFGSLTTRMFGEIMRPAIAEARAVLLKMASEKLSVPVNRLQVSAGVVSDKQDGSKKVTYAELAMGQKIYRELDVKPKIKDHKQFRIMGHSQLRRDSMEKVTGKALYSGDIKLPGMLYARILRPTALGAKMTSVDTSQAEAMEGVEIFRDGDLVAVLHPHPDTADVAIAKVKAEFDVPEPKADTDSIFSYLLKSANDNREVQKGGNLEEGEALSDDLFDRQYDDGYVLHAPMENHSATAVMEGDRMVIWGSTQTPFRAKEEVAQILGMAEEKVHVRQVFVGGGFGGKSTNQQIVEAARIAKATGKPINNMWTRREECLYDRMRPAAVVKIKSGMTKDGRISLWDFGTYFAGSRGSEEFYDIPHYRTLSWDVSRGSPQVHPFYTGAWRAPANNTNTFGRESQIDIMAAKAGIDPLEFRLMNLKDEKMIRVLKEGASKFGWKPAAAPSGRGYGMACGIDAGTWVCVMVEVEVDKGTGHVQVKRATVSQDMGMVVNPEGAIIQAEGCVTMGLGYALGEEVDFEGTRMITQNFDTYEFTHFSWVPETIDVHIVDAMDQPPQGGGEPAIICMGACVANAIFDATGARVFRLPMTAERVLDALKKV